MKLIIKVLVLIFALVSGILYYFFSPILNVSFVPETKWGMSINRPTLVPVIDDSKDFSEYSHLHYKFYFSGRPAEGFEPGKIFKNYQIVEDFSNGKYYFYCKNKKTYAASWIKKDDTVFIVQYSVNSNISDWIRIALKVIAPSAEGIDEAWITRVETRIAKKYGMVSMKVLLLIIGGTFILVLLLVVFLGSLSGRRPAAVNEIESEGIVWERSGAPAVFRSTINYNISTVYLVMTGSYFRIYSMGKEVVKISAGELQNHIKNSKAVFKYRNIKVEINTRYLENGPVSM